MAKLQALPDGIEVRGNRIRVCFKWQGERFREAYPFPATPDNIKRAGRLYREIRSSIDLGVFTVADLRRHFPNSTRLDQLGSASDFGLLAQAWLDGVEVSHNTRTEYRKVLNKYWMPVLAGRPIDSIRYSEIRKLVTGVEWTSAKTRNNALIPLRGIFKMALEDELIERDPTARVRNQEHQKEPPDPFTRDEAETIIAALYRELQGTDAIHACYFEFAFFTGMRTSEMLALRWEDIDFRTGYARVSKAQSKGRLNERTKTAKVRDVLLHERAIHALKKAKPLTALAGAEVFRSLVTGEGFKTERQQRKLFTRTLRKLGIRHRPAYNTRHSYATMLLMAGANPSFVAGQLGHSAMMTLTIYSKWLKGAADAAELAKLDGNHLGGPQTCPKDSLSD